MELGAEISQKVKKTIKKQLQTLGCYVDDELPEYIMVMIANKRTQDQMVEDLNLFLNDEADKFVAWLTAVLSRIQRAMELPDIDAFAEDVAESYDLKKKPKKVKKDRNISESGENRKDDRHERKKSEEEKKRLRDRKGEVEEKEKEKRRQERPHREREKEGKENERRYHKEHNARMDDRSRSGKEIPNSRDEEIIKRRSARERRDKEEKEKREYKKKKEREEQEEKENRDKERERRHKEEKKRHGSRKSEEGLKHEKEKETYHNGDCDSQKVNGLDDIKHKETDDDLKKEADDGKPMEFVEQIKDTSHQIIPEPVRENGSDGETKTDGDVDFKREIVDDDVCDVSLQADSQYEEENDKETDEKVENDENKSQGRSRRHSTHRHRSSRSRSKSASRHNSHRESRSANKSRSSKSKSCERAHKHNHSEEQERKSRKDHERSSSKEDKPSDHHSTKTRSEADEDGRRRSQENSKSVDNDASRRKDSRSGTPTRRSSQDHRRSNNEVSSKINGNDVVDKVKEDDEVPAKPTVASKVEVNTDFSQKPSLPQHNEALITVVLKSAVTEVVDEKPDEENVEDDVELDYNETNDENEFSDEANNDVFLERRRVINFDKEKSGLPTITVNFNKENSPIKDNKHKHSTRTVDRDHSRRTTSERGHTRSSNHSSSHLRRSDVKDDEKRKGHIDKNDARYTILRSRLDHNGSTNDRRVRHETRQEKSSNSERHHSSIAADMEEKSKRHSARSSWRDQRNSSDSRHKQIERQRGSHRRRTHTGGGESSGDDEDKQRRVKELKEEAMRIEIQELSRSRQSDEGDLRDLLLGKREAKSSSEDEEALAQRLREKIKEEKHKRLFHKSNSEDRSKTREDQDNLGDRLNAKKKRRSSDNEIEKVTENGERMEQTDLNLESVSDTEEDEENIEAIDEHGMENNKKEKNSDDDSREVQVNGDGDDDGDDEDDEDDDESQEDDKKEEEECQQEQKVVNHIQDDLEEVSDEELVDDSEKEIDEEQDKAEEHKVEKNNTAIEEPGVLDEKAKKELCEDVVEVEEEVEIEVEVSDNDNLDGDDDYIMTQEINTGGKKSEMLRIIEGVDVENISILEKYPELRSEPEPMKNNTPTESSASSPINIDENENIDENIRDETANTKNSYDKKSKDKYSKRKRMRHEVVVTLDGLCDGKQLSLRTNKREKSPKVQRLQERQKSDRNRRHSRHTSRCNSDEEVEEIVWKKEEGRRSISRNRTPDGKSGHRSHSQLINNKDFIKYHDFSTIDREILIAENKLKSQKMFKQSLQTVHNVNGYTIANIGHNMFNGTLKTFINPNFQMAPFPMIPMSMFPMKPLIITAPVLKPVCNMVKPMCNLPHSHSETAKLVPTVAINIPPVVPSVVPSPPEKITVTSVSMPMPKDNIVMPPAPLDIVNLPHVESSLMNKNTVVQPVDANKDTNSPASSESLLAGATDKTPVVIDDESADNISVSSSLPTQPPVSVEPISQHSPVPVVAKTSIPERCVYWPECKNLSCAYIHPSVNCKMFPNCSYGQHCIYIHPPCMFGDNCSNSTCQFMHISSTSFSGFTQICKYYPNCNRADCPFKHIDKVVKPCHFGADCKNPECIFSHDDPELK